MADEFVALFAGETFTPELVWGEVNRTELGEVIKTLFAGINITSPKIARGEGGSWPVSPVLSKVSTYCAKLRAIM